MHILKVSRKPIDNAVSAVRRAAAEWREIDEQIAALPPVTLESHGRFGVEKHQEQLAALAAEKAEISARALETVQQEKARFLEFVAEVSEPDGADTKNDDYALLRDSLISSPQELQRVLDRHRDSVVFRRAAEKYAAAREWSGFTSLDSSTLFRAFTDSFFDGGCVIGAQSPDGYAAVRVTHPGEVERVLHECGLPAECLV